MSNYSAGDLSESQDSSTDWNFSNGARTPIIVNNDAQALAYDPDTIDFDFDYQNNFFFPEFEIIPNQMEQFDKGILGISP